MHQETSYNIVILGSSGVGKSALTVTFVNRRSTPQGLEAHTSMTVDGKQHSVSITTEQEEFVAMREQYIKQGDGFIFLYSITDFKSFISLSNHLQTFQRSCDSRLKPIMVVGNKTDLEDQRKVSYRAGASLAGVLDCNFMEVSASTGKGIKDMLSVIIREITRAKKNRW